MSRARKEAEDNYLLYAKKTEEARIAESLDQQKISNVAIAETPTEPHLPSKPDVPLNIALGVVLACFLSLGGAFTAEYFSDTVAQPAELEELTGLPVLALTYRS
jgi:tyrosine-protein kinase Etk/Wzc